MKSRYRKFLLSALFCLILFGCTSTNSNQMTCGYAPHEVVVIEGGGIDGSDISGMADEHGCVTHPRGTHIQHIPIHE